MYRSRSRLVAACFRIGIAIAGVLVAFAIGEPAATRTQQDLVNQARRLDLDGRHEEAIALYRQVLERTPDSFDAHYGIARALDLIGDYEQARRHFASAIDLADEGAQEQSLRMLAISYVFTGATAEAARYFQEVFDRRVAGGNRVGAAEVANELGRVYLEAGDLENAQKWYETGYQTAARQPDRLPSDVDLAELRWAHARARIAARSGDAAEAWRQTSQVRRVLDAGANPDQQIHYPYLVGYVHFYLREYDRAAAELQQADQDDPFILVLLGQAHEQLGQMERAREYYRRALLSTSHAVTNAFARPLARGKIDR